jgi:rare lipoprotein A
MKIGRVTMSNRVLSCLRRQLGQAAGALAALALVGCGSVPLTEPAQPRAAQPSKSSSLPVLPPAGSGRGGYYQDDGPGDNPPPGLLELPDPEPKVEPYSARGNRPYVVFGKTYTPFTDNRPFKQRGVGSWYGKKFHGQKTSSGEPYDMYKMTAAHPTLPIPSYARVTNLSNGKQVIVRVNDRGPFHSSRIMDLSYTAALKLGYLGSGSGQLELERLLPDEIERINAARRQGVPPQARPADAAAAEPVAVAAVDQAVTIMPVAFQPAPEAVPAAPAATPGATNAAGGYYLQFGAFSQPDNARATRERLQQKWVDGLPVVELVASGPLFRLYSGPFASRTDADVAAQRVEQAGLGKPVVVQR